MGDEQRVLQIGRALVENALVHTPRGNACGGACRGTACSRSRTMAPGSRREHAEQVFERFYRGDGPRASGSGLGLAIARELALAMGGSLELESERGRTVFRLRLPAESRIAEPMRN